MDHQFKASLHNLVKPSAEVQSMPGNRVISILVPLTASEVASWRQCPLGSEDLVNTSATAVQCLVSSQSQEVGWKLMPLIFYFIRLSMR